MKQKKITVIHFVHTLYGGVANVAAGLMNHQHVNGIKTILAYCHYDNSIESQLNHDCEKIKISMASIPGFSMLLGMKVFKVYTEYTRTHQDELVIVHAHNVQALGCFANWKKIPIICTLHGFNCPQKSHRKLFSDFLYRRTLTKLLKYNKQITAVSKAIVDADECKRITNKSKITVIHNFTEVDIYDKRLHNFFNVGHVGDLSYEKGWDTLWSAYKLLTAEERANIHLYAAGKESDFSAKWLSDEAQIIMANNSVYYEGYVANAKKDFISKLDVLVLASRNEGLGLVQIEAMGYGIPVLARDTGGICEVLVDGFNGFVIKDEYDLCRRIKELYSDGECYLRLSQNALNTYREKFCTEVIMDKYKVVYKKLIEEYQDSSQ